MFLCQQPLTVLHIQRNAYLYYEQIHLTGKNLSSSAFDNQQKKQMSPENTASGTLEDDVSWSWDFN